LSGYSSNFAIDNGKTNFILLKTPFYWSKQPLSINGYLFSALGVSKWVF